MITPNTRVKIEPMSEAAKRRAAAADAKFGQRCLVENCPKERVVEMAHVFPRERAENPSTMTSIEWTWGMREGSLNLDTSRNILFRASLHHLFKEGKWVLMPEDHIINRYWDDELGSFHAFPRLRDDFPPELTDATFKYRFTPLVDMESFGITRQTQHPPTRAGFTNHVYPFASLPTLTSHIDPKFAILHMGQSICKRSSSPAILKLLADNPLMERVRQTYLVWIDSPVWPTVKNDPSWLAEPIDSDQEVDDSDVEFDANSHRTNPRRLGYGNPDISSGPRKRLPASDNGSQAEPRRAKHQRISSNTDTKFQNANPGWTNESISAWARNSSSSPPPDSAIPDSDVGR